MAIFSKRKVQAAKDHLMQNMTDTELDELQEYLRNRPRKVHSARTSTQSCGFFKLPAELRNYIYNDVAADAHAQVTTSDLKDANGRKVRPGLLGTCYQIYQEFFGVFWSPKYIHCEIFGRWGDTVGIAAPTLLHAIMHELYGSRVTTTHTNERLDAVEYCKNYMHGLRNYSLERGRGPESRHLDFIDVWVGFVRPRGIGQTRQWTEVAVWLIHTDSPTYKSSCRYLRYVELQGLTMNATVTDQRRPL
jgi:hypothetical protein